MLDRRSPRACVALSLLLLVPQIVCADMLRRFSVTDDIERTEFKAEQDASAAKFSPDAKYFSIVTQRAHVGSNELEASLWLFSTRDVHEWSSKNRHQPPPAPLELANVRTQKNGPAILDVRWLDDSTGVAFLGVASNGNRRLFVADIAGRTVTARTPEDQFVTAYDIRNGNIAYTASSALLRGSSGVNEDAVVITGKTLWEILFPADRYPEFGGREGDLNDIWAIVNGKRFQIVDGTSQEPIRTYVNAGGTFGIGKRIAISEDGRTVVVPMPVAEVPKDWELYQPPEPSGARIKSGKQDLRSFWGGREYAMSYTLVDLVTGVKTPLVRAPTGGYTTSWFDPGQTADWSVDGQMILLSSTFLPLDSSDPSILKARVARPCVAVVHLASKRVDCVVSLIARSQQESPIEDVHFGSRTEREVIVRYGASRDAGGVRFRTYRAGRDGEWILTDREHLASAGSPIEIHVHEGLNTSPVLVVTDKRSRKIAALWDPNPQLKEIALGEASVFRWKDGKGRQWVGGLVKPPDYQENRRYPLVIQAHGFSENRFITNGGFTSNFVARPLAAAGIMVLQVRDTRDGFRGPLEGPSQLDGYAAAIEQLSATGLIDPERVGMIGFSRTCLYTLQALTTNRPKLAAASITDGVNNTYWQYLASIGSDRFLNGTDALVGSPPFGSGLRRWLEVSPGFNMDKVSAPLLMVEPGPQAVLADWEPYAALRRLGKPVDLIMLPTRAHQLSNPRQRLVAQGTNVDWFRFWLMDEEDPSVDKVEQYRRWRALRQESLLNRSKQPG